MACPTSNRDKSGTVAGLPGMGASERLCKPNKDSLASPQCKRAWSIAPLSEAGQGGHVVKQFHTELAIDTE